MNKRIIALIAMLLVICMVMPSCGKDGDSETTEKESEVEITETEEITTETTEAEEETTETETEVAVETMLLTDVEGKEKVYQIVGKTEIEGVKYVALLEASIEEDDLDISNAEIYRVETEGDEEKFVLIEDNDESASIFAEIFPADTTAPEETTVDKITDSDETTVSPESNGVGGGGVDISFGEVSGNKDTEKTETTKKEPVQNGTTKVESDPEKPETTHKDTVDSSEKETAKETKPSVDVTVPEETNVPDETTRIPEVTTEPYVETTEPVTETTYPLDTVVPLEFVTTNSGKVLIHTISDRTTNKTDDNSNTLAFIPIRDPNAKVDMKADYNDHKVNLASARPGTLRYGVLFGYDDYLFYKDTLNDFQGLGVLATSLYNKAVEDLKERNNWVEANDMKFYFVIAPNKNTVYPDYMPESYTLGEYRRYDQFVELLGDAGITAVDLRETMANAVKANPQENLYYKYDTHWNNHAGYYAYRTAMDLIDDDFPNVVIHDRSEYQINYTETYMKDLCWYTGNYDRVKDYGPVYTLKSGPSATLTWKGTAVKYGQYQFSNINTDGYSDRLVHFKYVNEANKNAPNIYVMRDSYSIALVPFMKDSFYKSTFNWTWEFSKEDIKNAEADMVMVIVAERNLRNYVNNKAVVD